VLARIWRTVAAPIGVVSGIIALMAQVPFSQAQSNIATYLEAVHLNKLAAALPTNIDILTTIAGAVTAALCAATIFEWRLDWINHRKRNEYLTLKDAAQHVYDETRHSVLSQIARDERLAGHDDPKLFIANTILQKAENLEGKVKGSTKYDPIPAKDRDRLWTDEKLLDAGPMHAPAKFYAIRIKRRELDGVIAYFEEASKIFDELWATGSCPFCIGP